MKNIILPCLFPCGVPSWGEQPVRAPDGPAQIASGHKHTNVAVDCVCLFFMNGFPPEAKVQRTHSISGRHTKVNP